MKLKEFYHKYINIIVIILLCVIVLKGCQGCSLKRRISYNNIQMEQVIDSLQGVVDENKDSVRYLQDTICSLRLENESLKGTISDLKSDKEYYKKVNTNLVNVTKNLSNKKEQTIN